MTDQPMTQITREQVRDGDTVRGKWRERSFSSEVFFDLGYPSVFECDLDDDRFTDLTFWRAAPDIAKFKPGTSFTAVVDLDGDNVIGRCTVAGAFSALVVAPGQRWRAVPFDYIDPSTVTDIHIPEGLDD